MNTIPPAPRVAAPFRCETLAEIVRREGGDFLPGAGTPGAEPREIRYALPTDADDDVLAWLRPLAKIFAPAPFVARLRAGRVAADGVPISADGAGLARDAAADFGKPFGRHWLLGHGRLRPPEALAGGVAVVAVHLGAGYAHWLLEELPRLLSLPAGAADTLIAHGESPFARDALAWRGGGERVVTPRRSSHFACAPLLVPALAAEAGAPTPASLDAAREFAASFARTTAGVGERIYVSRARARRRRVAGEDALLAELGPRGFRVLHLEAMGWAEQIAAFRDARVVVAPHGAGLANLAFCSPGTRVVELVNRAYFNPTFWRVAALRGLDYRPLVSRAAAGDQGDRVREDRRANREDIVAEPARVAAALRGD